MACSPRYSTCPTDRPNRLPQVEAIAEALGTPLIPWQRQVAEVATEFDPITGIPAYREVFVTTPRQSGKTTIILALQLLRSLAWNRPQACVWTAQRGKDGRKKWMDEIVPMLDRSPLGQYVTKVRRVNGDEGVSFATGSRIDIYPPTADAGHGMTVDSVVMDEIFADTENHREATWIPAMSRRPDAQLFMCSTAGTAASTVFNRRVVQGRNAVADGATTGIAYFEWSAPDDWTEDDPPETWWEFMPALGHGITEDVIAQARDTLRDEPGEFARAYGNRPQIDAMTVFPPQVWSRIVNRNAEAEREGVSIGLDVSAERDSAAIAVCDPSGTVELVDYRFGVDWLVEAAEKLSKARGHAWIHYDKNGPVGAVDGIDQLRRSRPLNSTEVVTACGGFYDAVADRKLSIRHDDHIETAVKGLARKNIGDRFCWSRSASKHDVAPLYAVTLAWSGSRATVPSPIFVSAS